MRQRVNEYFRTNRISRYGNINIMLKSGLMTVLYFLPLALIFSGVTTNLWLFFGLWILAGFGKSGIGMNVIHDANHGSYSKNQKVNRLMSLVMNLIGANSSVWKIQHNVLHHSYTNIEGHDEDISVPGVLRFSPHQRRRRIHRLQFIYAWFFYAISTLNWMTIKDFFQAARYHKTGIITTGKFRRVLGEIIGWKIVYYSYILGLPALLLPVPFWIILAGFVAMHLVSGLVLSIIFQTAHVMPDNTYPLPDADGHMNSNWMIHQMSTTSNYAPSSRIFSWLVGGLNYQVEHHLFSNICHVHYRRISAIVKETAAEFGVDYRSRKSFLSALSDHARMLYHLGKAA